MQVLFGCYYGSSFFITCLFWEDHMKKCIWSWVNSDLLWRVISCRYATCTLSLNIGLHTPYTWTLKIGGYFVDSIPRLYLQPHEQFSEPASLPTEKVICLNKTAHQSLISTLKHLTASQKTISSEARCLHVSMCELPVSKIPSTQCLLFEKCPGRYVSVLQVIKILRLISSSTSTFLQLASYFHQAHFDKIQNV